jgi:hypothetical protein
MMGKLKEVDSVLNAVSLSSHSSEFIIPKPYRRIFNPGNTHAVNLSRECLNWDYCDYSDFYDGEIKRG